MIIVVLTLEGVRPVSSIGQASDLQSCGLWFELRAMRRSAILWSLVRTPADALFLRDQLILDIESNGHLSLNADSKT